MRTYKELVVWQKSMVLVRETYIISKQLPLNEKYTLSSQMLRAAISIPSNIAEGWSRNRQPEFIRYLEIAYASSCELDTQIIISQEQYSKINYQNIQSILIEVQKMLSGLIKKIRNNLTNN